MTSEYFGNGAGRSFVGIIDSYQGIRIYSLMEMNNSLVPIKYDIIRAKKIAKSANHHDHVDCFVEFRDVRDQQYKVFAANRMEVLSQTNLISPMQHVRALYDMCDETIKMKGKQ